MPCCAHLDTPIATQSARAAESGVADVPLDCNSEVGEIADEARTARASLRPPHPPRRGAHARPNRSTRLPGPSRCRRLLRQGRARTPVLSVVQRYVEGADALSLLFSLHSPQPPPSFAPAVKIVVVVVACQIRPRLLRSCATSILLPKIQTRSLKPTRCSGAKPPHLWRRRRMYTRKCTGLTRTSRFVAGMRACGGGECRAR